jgi:hypothetical protein
MRGRDIGFHPTPCAFRHLRSNWIANDIGRKPMFRHARLLAVAACCLAAPAALGQDYKAPRNGYGQPEFSGAWTNESLTPFERSAQYGERLVMTEEEVARLEKGADARWDASNARTNPNEGAPNASSVGGYNSY